MSFVQCPPWQAFPAADRTACVHCVQTSQVTCSEMLNGINVNPRRAGSVCDTPSLSFFFRRSLKAAAQGAAVFGTPVHTCFPQCENFRPRSLKVRSPANSRPHLRKSLNTRHSYTELPVTLKLKDIDMCNSSRKISEFLYR